MKALTLFIVCVASVSLAEDFKTIDGQEYKDVSVSRVEPDGLVLITSTGISKIYFAELPKDVQERFHYDPAKAATFVSEQNAERERFQKQGEEARKRAEETEKHWREQTGSKAQSQTEVDQSPPRTQSRRSSETTEHLYQLAQDHTIQIRVGLNGASIRLKRGDRYPGRILGDHGEIDINGISYWVPTGILIPVRD
jgi:hypothetical protein